MKTLIKKLTVLTFMVLSISISVWAESTLYLFFSLPSSAPNHKAQISFNNENVFLMSKNSKVTCSFISQGILNISYSVQSFSGDIQLDIQAGQKYYVKIENENSEAPQYSITQLTEKEGKNAWASYRYLTSSNFGEDTSMEIFKQIAGKDKYTRTFSGQNRTNNGTQLDQEFEWKVKPHLSGIKAFSHDLIAASENNKWGFADKNGNWIISPTFNNVKIFTEEFAAVKKMAGNILTEYLWGYIDKTGELKIQPKFKDVLPFNEGLAAVLQSSGWGFIDKSGNYIIPSKFDKVESFSQDLAAVQYESKWGYIDKKGNWTFKAFYDDAYSFSEGLALVKEKGKWGYIDKTGKWIIMPQFNDAVSFTDGIAGAQLNGAWGFIDKLGNWTIQPQFTNVGIFSEGMAGAQLNGKWGFINNAGEWVIEPEFAQILFFENGIAAVKENGKWGFIGKTGNLIINPQFDDILNLSDKENQMVAVKQNEIWGIISITSATALIKSKVEEKINKWQQKDEFENSAEYRSRVNEQTRNAKVREYTEEVINGMKNDYSQKIVWSELQLDEYDADHETFRVKSIRLGDFIISVPKSEGKLFKENWGKMKFSNADFFIQSEKFILAKVTISNPVNGKKYLYDSKNITDYEIKDIIYDPIIYDDDDFVQNETNPNNSNTGKKNKANGPSDVDLNIPVAKDVNAQTYAVVIGNENYKNEIAVEFAKNDARIFKEYLVKTLGIPEKQIHLKENATFADMLGEIDWLTNIGKAFGNEAKIIFYYAGHGMPDNENKSAYLLPVDGNASQVKIAISTDELYTSLSQSGATQATVFLDACFSGAAGGGMLATGRGVKLKPKEDTVTGKLVVFSAVSGDQTAHPYKEKSHGLFSYFLMKKIKDTSGNVTYQELNDYISKNVNQISVVEGKGNVQTPKVNVSADVQEEWMNWKLK